MKRRKATRDRSRPPVKRADKKILVVSDSFRLRTGFATVARALADHICWNMPDWELAYLGWFDQPTSIVRPYKLFATSRAPQSKEQDKYAYYTFPSVIDDYKPDVVWTVGDIWMTYSYTEGPRRNCYRLINYVPIDGYPVPKITYHGSVTEIDWIKTFRNVDELVAYGPFGMNGINERVGEQICKEWIPHGVYTDVYQPVDDLHRLHTRALTFNLPRAAFLFGAFSRNQPRKAYDRILCAFAELLKREDPSRPLFLYFHCAPRDVGWVLETLAEDLGISHRVIFNHYLKIGQGYSDYQLNQLYNACDATILPSRGEGFGLTMLESMSAGVPVITTNYSGQMDFTKKGCLHADICAYDMEPLTNIRRAIVDIPDLAEKMYQLYDNPDYAEELGEEAREHALQYDWKVILGQWEHMIRRQPLYKNKSYTESLAEEEQTDTSQLAML